VKSTHKSLLFTFYYYENKLMNKPKHIFYQDAIIAIGSYFLYLTI